MRTTCTNRARVVEPRWGSGRFSHVDLGCAVATATPGFDVRPRWGQTHAFDAVGGYRDGAAPLRRRPTVTFSCNPCGSLASVGVQKHLVVKNHHFPLIEKLPCIPTRQNYRTTHSSLARAVCYVSGGLLLLRRSFRTVTAHFIRLRRTFYEHEAFVIMVFVLILGQGTPRDPPPSINADS